MDNISLNRTAMGLRQSSRDLVAAAGYFSRYPSLHLWNRRGLPAA